MYYFILDSQDNVIAISETFNHLEDTRRYQTRHDFECLEQAAHIAESATKHAGEKYIAIDAGEWVSPRYDVIRMPKVGDEVSYAFNGDYYPDGEIASISTTGKLITTTSGKKYYRRKQSGSWINGGTWSLIHGHHNESNPAF